MINTFKDLKESMAIMSEHIEESKCRNSDYFYKNEMEILQLKKSSVEKCKFIDLGSKQTEKIY